MYTTCNLLCFQIFIQQPDSSTKAEALPSIDQPQVSVKPAEELSSAAGSSSSVTTLVVFTLKCFTLQSLSN